MQSFNLIDPPIFALKQFATDCGPAGSILQHTTNLWIGVYFQIQIDQGDSKDKEA